VTIGVYTLELHLPGARSLKDKRQVFRRIKDRLRSRYNVAVSESAEHSNLWQRGEITVVSVSENRDSLVRLFESVFRDAESGVPGQVIEHGPEFVESGAGPDDWCEDDA
jgi:uncharacterized protein YlxP (DUF503 family)